MVTAETAVVLPVLLLVLAGAVSAVVVVGAQLRCVDAAREGARAAARGEAPAAVVRLATAAAPDGAVTEVGGGEAVRVTVSATVSPLGPLPWHVEVSATATGVREPGVER
jgi:Flp pilus assembly protein TadG